MVRVRVGLGLGLGLEYMVRVRVRVRVRIRVRVGLARRPVGAGDQSPKQTRRRGRSWRIAPETRLTTLYIALRLV